MKFVVILLKLLLQFMCTFMCIEAPVVPLILDLLPICYHTIHLWHVFVYYYQVAFGDSVFGSLPNIQKKLS